MGKWENKKWQVKRVRVEDTPHLLLLLLEVFWGVFLAEITDYLTQINNPSPLKEVGKRRGRKRGGRPRRVCCCSGCSHEQEPLL